MKQAIQRFLLISKFVFRMIPNLRIVECNIILQNFASLYFTIQEGYYGLLDIPLVSVAHNSYLPNESTHQFTLILDMDETLIHFVNQTKSMRLEYLLLDQEIMQIGFLTKSLLINKSNLDYIDNMPYLSRLGRSIAKCIIIDKIAANYQHQEENEIQIKIWCNDPEDKELVKVGAILRQLAKGNCEDVRDALQMYNKAYVQ
ncbi:unnamed protein product (macronuclear) [Paramecium tetraurelia]|uniref:Mitochondrial import inner membrane translocase subunit TIM50 n=1 Tax=Paramecium tetraurelia TaxID=5888 RepID=A0CWI4_PARTE|nr:uncharacterized protein GSPATT00001354001 [Paramecium tetraurelia]CAK75151.1 unnamed protein product [Paramecium tetraurelia]|eukprot:XP_001442548.1 hypothetical protein (macronuclear) [Paramecium tetraurelia strain d4-2]